MSSARTRSHAVEAETVTSSANMTLPLFGCAVSDEREPRQDSPKALQAI